jgi:hypothetical protein
MFMIVERDRLIEHIFLKSLRFVRNLLQLTSKAPAPHPPEMEFLGISLTRDSSLLLHAIHSPFYLRIKKKTILYSGFKNTYKKSAKQE